MVLALGVLALFPASAGARGGAVSSAVSGPTRNWIVGMRSTPNTGSADFLSAGGNASVNRVAQQSEAYSIKISQQTRPADVIAQWMQNPSVAYIEPDITYTWPVDPNDKLYAQQNWAKTDDLPNAWSIATGQPSTIVAVLDSGVRADHPDLVGKVLPGYDFFNNDSDPTDDVGHGTAVAGLSRLVGMTGSASPGWRGTSISCR